MTLTSVDMLIAAFGLAVRSPAGPSALLARQNDPIDVNSLPPDCQPSCSGVNTIADVRLLCFYPSVTIPCHPRPS
jgi:hypothetical protein